MSLLTVSNLSKSFGALDLFANVSFGVPQGARLALIGPNGCGKTTLLRILVGQEEPSGGEVRRARNLRLGYLPQEATFTLEGTLWEVCEEVFSDLQMQQEELHRLEAAMSDPKQAPAVLERYGVLQAEFERRGGYTYPTRIQQVLTGLGFAPQDFHLPVAHLSGGQRTRAHLARLLLSSPDLLLLDEPTNHLDMQAVEWLEEYLNQWDGAAVIVSHDRYFLDRVCNGVLELSGGRLATYSGNYTTYLQERQRRAEYLQEQFEAERERLLREVEYIKKNISGQNVSQAKGRLRRLSRLVQAMEQVGLEAVLGQKWSEVSTEATVAVSPFGVEEAERRVRALRSPVRTLPRLHLHLRSTLRSGELVLRTSNLIVGYPGRPLFRAPDIVLRRGECAALIGPNGAGKTTFLKTLLGQLPPLEGEVTLGASLNIGYFAQAHEGLKPSHTLLEEIQTVMPAWLPGQVRDYLGKYLFSGDDVFKTVSMLSGGERSRLALAKLALQDTNLLLLDEPTNHLDIPSQETLQAVLDEYPGAIVLVTHDRYLIDALATQIWEILPDESSLDVFLGTYSQRREERAQREARKAEEAARNGQPAEGSSGSAPPRERVRSPKAELARQAARTEKRRLAQIQELENQILALEHELAQLGAYLENPPADMTRVIEVGQRYARLQTQRDELLARWELLQSEAPSSAI
ncbi:MAG: ABC-F family ATP-binding cassette domain-containing protein [Anaerolineales bacterium]|nr:ABC-F family ATP-binding cassette domain-containing protein [Anaerolineales bacterium]MCX7609383.1 ABC-F family ATP-binding cassette domain-containing protein [Anaerolineales bacterium]MDW8227205.1 ABC-F family ATP-binding cassette domain-containing protein [Anaerolineales bacterium]